MVGPGVRPNRDTLYSQAVFDLDAGPVTITLPAARNRFMSMTLIDEDHFVPEVAGPCTDVEIIAAGTPRLVIARNLDGEDPSAP